MTSNWMTHPENICWPCICFAWFSTECVENLHADVGHTRENILPDESKRFVPFSRNESYRISDFLIIQCKIEWQSIRSQKTGLTLIRLILKWATVFPSVHSGIMPLMHVGVALLILICSFCMTFVIIFWLEHCFFGQLLLVFGSWVAGTIFAVMFLISDSGCDAYLQ